MLMFCSDIYMSEMLKLARTSNHIATEASRHREKKYLTALNLRCSVSESSVPTTFALLMGQALVKSIFKKVSNTLS